MKSTGSGAKPLVGVALSPAVRPGCSFGVVCRVKWTSLLPAGEGRPSSPLTVPAATPQSLELGTLKLLLTIFIVPAVELYGVPEIGPLGPGGLVVPVIIALASIGLEAEAIRQPPPNGTPSILIQTLSRNEALPSSGLIVPVIGAAGLMWTVRSKPPALTGRVGKLIWF